MPTSIATNKNRRCSVMGCTRPMKTYKEYCPSHYQKWKRTGNPLINQREMHGMARYPEYSVWVGIKDRCYNKNAGDNWDWYGGRGIKVCEQWLHSFRNFYEDMGPRPTLEHSIERKDVNGNYEPSNCIWVTMKAQANNRRNHRLITYKGVTRNWQQWSEETGIKYTTIRQRVKLGWDPEKIITQPVHKNSPNFRI